MNTVSSLKKRADVRLDINRDSEVLNQFVRINLDDQEIIEGDQKDPLKGTRRLKDEKDKIQHEQHSEHQEMAEKIDAATIEKASPPVDDKIKATIGQKQLNQELKKRKRRRRPKPEEIYTDKDRAAAVNMGTRDIKHSLKMKRIEDRTKALQMPVEADPGTFLALGNSEIVRGDPVVALIFYNKV